MSYLPKCDMTCFNSKYHIYSKSDIEKKYLFLMGPPMINKHKDTFTKALNRLNETDDSLSKYIVTELIKKYNNWSYEYYGGGNMYPEGEINILKYIDNLDDLTMIKFIQFMSGMGWHLALSIFILRKDVEPILNNYIQKQTVEDKDVITMMGFNVYNEPNYCYGTCTIVNGNGELLRLSNKILENESKICIMRRLLHIDLARYCNKITIYDKVTSLLDFTQDKCTELIKYANYIDKYSRNNFLINYSEKAIWNYVLQTIKDRHENKSNSSVFEMDMIECHMPRISRVRMPVIFYYIMKKYVKSAYIRNTPIFYDQLKNTAYCISDITELSKCDKNPITVLFYFVIFSITHIVILLVNSVTLLFIPPLYILNIFSLIFSIYFYITIPFRLLVNKYYYNNPDIYRRTIYEMPEPYFIGGLLAFICCLSPLIFIAWIAISV